MKYMEKSEIRKYKIDTDDLSEERAALVSYYYRHCPRCKKVLDVVDGRFTKKCLHCGQAVHYQQDP